METLQAGVHTAYPYTTDGWRSKVTDRAQETGEGKVRYVMGLDYLRLRLVLCR